MADAGRFFVVSEPTYSKQAYVLMDPPVINQEFNAISSALHSLGQFVPFSFFTPGYIFVTKNCVLVELNGKNLMQRYIDKPGAITVYAYYIPLEMQAEWFLEWRRDNIDSGLIINNAVEKYLAYQHEKYAEAIA
jgi:hypothetical protein